MSDKIKAAATSGEWITDRRPTEDDGSKGAGWVMVTTTEGTVSTSPWRHCGDRPWMCIPAPYQPPQPDPDTSLEADCKEVEQWVNSYGRSINRETVNRIIEAARKVEELERERDLLKQEVKQLWIEKTQPNEEPMNLARRIAGAINSVSAENGSNTPDFILANYLVSCLDAFDRAINARTEWFEPTTEEPASQNDPDGVGEGFEKALPDNAEQYSYDGVQWNSMEMYPLTTFNTPPTMFRRRIEPAEAPPATADCGKVTQQQARQVAKEVFANAEGRTHEPAEASIDADSEEVTNDSGSVPQDAAVTEPLREIWEVGSFIYDVESEAQGQSDVSGSESVHYREVSPELDQWHAELVRLCEELTTGRLSRCDVTAIDSHLAKRPQRGVK